MINKLIIIKLKPSSTYCNKQHNVYGLAPKTSPLTREVPHARATSPFHHYAKPRALAFSAAYYPISASTAKATAPNSPPTPYYSAKAMTSAAPPSSPRPTDLAKPIEPYYYYYAY